MINNVLRTHSRSLMGAAIGLMIYAVGPSSVVGQVVYNDGGVHLLDESHVAPNGDLMEGVLVENDTTLTIRDLNANGHPAVGGVGFSITRDFGEFPDVEVDDLIVVTTDTSRADIEGGTYSEGMYENELKLIAYDASALSVHGGRFEALNLNLLTANGASTFRVAGGRFVSRANHLTVWNDGEFIVTGGELITVGSNNNNLLLAVDDSTFTIAGGSFKPAAHNGFHQRLASTFNITGGEFFAPQRAELDARQRHGRGQHHRRGFHGSRRPVGSVFR